MIVYKATNITNKKVYIGITTKTLEHRMKIHKRDSKKLGTYFYNAIRKYGFDNFKWEVIDTASSIDELHKKEIYYISKYNSFDNKDLGTILHLVGVACTRLQQMKESEEAKELRVAIIQCMVSLEHG